MSFLILSKVEQKPITRMVTVSIVIYLILLISVLLIKPSYFVYTCLLIPAFPIFLYVLINKLETSFLLYVAIMPIIQHLSMKSIAIGDFRITPDILIHFILMIAIVYNFIFTYKSKKSKKLILQDKLILLFLLFSIFSLISASALPINHDKRLLLYYTGVFQTIAFYFAVLFLLNNQKNFENKLLFALALTSFFAAFIAFIEIRSIGFNLINIFISRTHIGFGYHNTNLFGLHVALVFPILIYLMNSEEHKKYRALIWLSFIILTILAILTLNRGTFIVIAINLFILYLKRENRKIVIGLLIAGTIGAIYFSDLLVLYINRFITNVGNNSRFLADESALFRLEVWRVAIETIFQYPLGVGGNGFHYMWERISTAPQLYFGTPHQILLYIAVDFGLPAMIIFIALIYTLFRNSYFIYKSNILNDNNIFFYLMLSLIGYLVHGFLTGGELSHLWGNVSPNNGFTYILMIIIAIISYHSQPLNSNSSSQ